MTAISLGGGRRCLHVKYLPPLVSNMQLICQPFSTLSYILRHHEHFCQNSYHLHFTKWLFTGNNEVENSSPFITSFTIWEMKLLARQVKSRIDLILCFKDMRLSADIWSHHYYICLSASTVTCIRMSWLANKGSRFSNLKIVRNIEAHQ